MKLPSFSSSFLLACVVPVVACTVTTPDVEPTPRPAGSAAPDDADAADDDDDAPATETPDDEPPASDDAGAAITCPLGEDAYVPADHPPRKVTNACSETAIAAFASCKWGANGSACQAAREQYPECGACLFSDAADAEWGLFVADPDAPDAVDGYRYNYGGCAELETNNETCGEVWQGSVSCPATVCAECSESERAECEADALDTGPCRSWSQSTAMFCQRMGLLDKCDDFAKTASVFCGF